MLILCGIGEGQDGGEGREGKEGGGRIGRGRDRIEKGREGLWVRI